MSVRVQVEDFDTAAEIATLTEGREDIGAVVTFTGLVRGGDIVALTLEHYPGMTERTLGKIEAEANARWPLKASLIVHRVGLLKAGARIVLVASASDSRQAAFDAANFLMDRLKTDAPFWKSETRADGRTAWIESRLSDDQARERWR